MSEKGEDKSAVMHKAKAGADSETKVSAEDDAKKIIGEKSEEPAVIEQTKITKTRFPAIEDNMPEKIEEQPPEEGEVKEKESSGYVFA